MSQRQALSIEDLSYTEVLTNESLNAIAGGLTLPPVPKNLADWLKLYTKDNTAEFGVNTEFTDSGYKIAPFFKFITKF